MNKMTTGYKDKALDILASLFNMTREVSLKKRVERLSPKARFEGDETRESFYCTIKSGKGTKLIPFNSSKHYSK